MKGILGSTGNDTKIRREHLGIKTYGCPFIWGRLKWTGWSYYWQEGGTKRVFTRTDPWGILRNKKRYKIGRIGTFQQTIIGQDMKTKTAMRYKIYWCNKVLCQDSLHLILYGIKILGDDNSSNKINTDGKPIHDLPTEVQVWI